ncbi:hypothetical protein CDAR_437021 [Caerostris darwini]|uniref:Uncharacterized protein n=1 Tax=Caerostris darwini TaxID=1538125 RepID=A0AAV4TSV2_9ARAC|nr:hypothetical protein CDAR_437021 [Caerostris darwini]
MKVLVLLCIVGAAYALPDDVCKRKTSEVCLSEYPSPLEVPSTEEGLKDVCGYFSDIMPCIKEFVDKCGTLNADLFRGEVLDDNIGNIIETTNAVCERGSRMHKVIVKNLPCIKEATEENSYCNQKHMNTLKLLREHLGSQELLPFQHVTRCLPAVLSNNCYVGQLYKNCGSDVKDEALVFLIKMKMLTSNCPKTLHPEFLILIELIERLTKEEVYVKSIFQ